MNKLRLSKSNIFTVTIAFLLVLALLPVGFINADHQRDDPDTTGPTPPVNPDLLPCENIDRGPVISPGPLDIANEGGTSGDGGREVPVYDDDVSENLQDILTVLSSIGDSLENQDEDSNYVREYLRLLCQKEYEEDHTLQHAWANLIGEFVDETLDFVHHGYGGNPAFITNQDVYYQLVNIATARVFMQDVVDSPNLGEETQRTIIESIARKLYSFKFPTTITIAEDDLPDDLASDFYGNGGYARYSQLLFDDDTNPNTVLQEAFAELNMRQQQQVSFEQEKLAWGRGFFSYEICDLGVYANPTTQEVNEEDRRNCRIATPGSTIQDQVSFVFGSALRQMEINDEYEEWIAPNTLAVLSDILSYRSLNNAETRNGNRDVMNAHGWTDVNAASPQVVIDQLNDSYNAVMINPPNNPPGDIPGIESTWDIGAYPISYPFADRDGPNQFGPQPFEFSRVYDSALYRGQNIENIGDAFFGDVLDPDFFLDQI